MNIKQLKSMIANLPDDMPVVECRDGNVSSWTDTPELSIRTVYKFNMVRNYGVNKGSLFQLEFCEVPPYESNGRDILSQYEALVFYTQE